MEIDINTAEALAVIRAIEYWLKTWPNEDMNSDLKSLLEKLDT